MSTTTGDLQTTSRRQKRRNPINGLLTDRLNLNSNRRTKNVIPIRCISFSGTVNVSSNKASVAVMRVCISDQLDHESCQRPKLKAVKMEQKVFSNDDTLRELEEGEVLSCSPEALENI